MTDLSAERLHLLGARHCWE